LELPPNQAVELLHSALPEGAAEDSLKQSNSTKVKAEPADSGSKSNPNSSDPSESEKSLKRKERETKVNHLRRLLDFISRVSETNMKSIVFAILGK